MAELAMNTLRILYTQDKLTLDVARGFVHDDEPCRVAVLNKPQAVRTEWLRSVDFRVWWRIMIPNHFLVGVDLRYTELVCEENVSARQENGIADFAPAAVCVRPDYLAVAHDEHPL